MLDRKGHGHPYRQVKEAKRLCEEEYSQVVAQLDASTERIWEGFLRHFGEDGDEMEAAPDPNSESQCN